MTRDSMIVEACDLQFATSVSRQGLEQNSSIVEMISMPRFSWEWLLIQHVLAWTWMAISPASEIRDYWMTARNGRSKSLCR